MLETNKNAVTVIYSGGDVQVPFLFYDAADLVVLVETTMKTMGADYTVTGAGNTAGGKVSFVNAPADGARVTVIRKIDFTQLLSIPQNGIIPEGALSKSLDRIVMMIQQLEERADRAVEYPEGTDKNDVANAQNILDSIEEGTQTITNAVQVAEATLQASNTALVASNKALNDAEAKRVLVNQNGDTQVERILTEGNKQDSRIETEGSKQVNLVKTEGEEKAAYVRNVGDWHYDRLVKTGNASVADITSLRDSSVSLIDTHKVEGVAQVEAAEQATMQRISDMPDYLPNFFAVFHEHMNKAIANELTGTGGKWKFVESVDYVFDYPDYYQMNFGFTTRLIVNEGKVTPVSFGSDTRLITYSYGVIVGDSGIPYLLCRSGGRSMNIHPYFGDVRHDFTAGNTYKVRVFRESFDAADQQAGLRDVNEFFFGGATATWDEFPNNPYYDFATNKYQQFNTELAYVTTSQKVKIVLHGVYDPVNPNISVSTNRYLQNVWEDSVTGAAMTYSAVDHTLTWEGTVTRATTFDEISALVRMDSGKVLSRGESYSMMDIILSDGATVYAVYFDDANKGVSKVGGMWQNRKIGATLYGNEAGFTTNVDSIIPVGTYCTANVGYWFGKDWKSQLLNDCPKYSAPWAENFRITLHLANKYLNVSAYLVVKVRDANGFWVEVPIGDAQTTLKCSFNGDENWLVLNIGGSYAVLGYSSPEDMLLHSAVWVTYKTYICPFEDIVNPQNVRFVGGAYLLQHRSDVIGGYLFQHLTGKAINSQGGYPTCDPAPRYQLAPAYGYVKSWFEYSTAYSVSDAGHPYRCMVAGGLAEISGTLHLVLWFRELVHDGAAGDLTWWGDDRQIPVVDYVSTKKDKNGHPVLCGCVAYNTKIPA